MDALQSNHLIDTEFVYLYPTKILEVPNYVILQSGATAGPSYLERPHLATRKSFDSDSSDIYALGLTLGRQSDLLDSVRLETNSLLSSQFAYSQNAIQLDYAVRNRGKSYSVGLFYATENDKLNSAENHECGIDLGFRVSDLTLAFHVSLLNRVDDPITATRLVVDQSAMMALLYEFDDIHFLVDLSSSRVERLQGVTQLNELEFLDYKMGAVKNIFNGGETVFYRINLETRQIKNRLMNLNTKDIQLPLTLGVESVLTDEIKLRSSIKQIIGVYQGEDFSPGKNTTTAAIGLGFVFNNLNIDGVLQGLIGPTANQQIDGNNFLTETSITYWF